MRKVRMITLSAGPLGVRQPGQVVEVTDEERDALVEGRFASDVVEAAVAPAPAEDATAGGAVEAATAPAPAESATAKKNKGKGGA